MKCFKDVGLADRYDYGLRERSGFRHIDPMYIGPNVAIWVTLGKFPNLCGALVSYL